MPPLPFDTTVTVLDSNRAVVAEDVAAAVRQLGSPRRTGTGQSYDWTGELEAAAAPYLVGKANVRLAHQGRQLAVLSAVEHEFLPHVEITASEVRPGG